MSYRNSYIRATEQEEEEEETSMATSKTSGSSQDNKVLKEQVEKLKESLAAERIKNSDANLPNIGLKIPEVSLVSPIMSMKTRKLLKGHQSRIITFDWSADKRHLVSGGQDGFAIVWDAFTAQKELLIETDCKGILSCSYSPSTTLVACSGMNNQCSVYKLDGPRPPGEDKITSPLRVAGTHTRYVTGCAFFGSDQQLLTSSGDSTCALWDLEKDGPVQEFKGHQLEVNGLAVNKFNPFSVFASCGRDHCVRLWDPRTSHCVQKFANLGSSVNSVVFFPTGDYVAAAVNDGTVHLIDLRGDQEVMVYSKPSILFGTSSVEFSVSGRVLFAGYNDHTIRSWDIVKGVQLGAWFEHQDRVSQVKMSPDGTALASCSWDATLRVWA